MIRKVRKTQQLERFLGGKNLLKWNGDSIMRQSMKGDSALFNLSHETSAQDDKANACSGEECRNCQVCFFDQSAQ